MSAKAKPQANDNQPAEGLPLFFKAPTLLSLEKHEKAGVKESTDYGFTRENNSIPINATEFIEAVKHFPIVFTTEETPTPVAVLGLEKVNDFVNTKGTWTKDAYIPAYARQYPFILFEREEDENLYLCVDEGAKNFEAKAGKDSLALYKDGEASEAAQNALNFCTMYYNHRKITETFCKDLKEMGLLMDAQSQAKLANGKEINLTGFKMIDENALNELSKEDFLKLRERNWLGLIYLALASNSNWQKLVDIAGKKAAN